MTDFQLRRRGATQKWLLPCIACIIAVLIGIGVYRHLHPPYSKATISQAAELEMPAWEWEDAKAATRHAASDTFSDADWQLTRKMCASSNKYQKTIGMSNVALLSKTKYRTEAINIARSGATSENPQLRLMSIGALAHFHDPTWRELATKCLDSQDSSLQQGAQTLLARQKD